MCVCVGGWLGGWVGVATLVTTKVNDSCINKMGSDESPFNVS